MYFKNADITGHFHVFYITKDQCAVYHYSQFIVENSMGTWQMKTIASKFSVNCKILKMRWFIFVVSLCEKYADDRIDVREKYHYDFH